MRKTIIICSIFPVLFFTGCSGDELEGNHVNDMDNDDLFSLTVNMPEGQSKKRVRMNQTEGSKNLTATWQADDEVLVFVTQGKNYFKIGDVKVSDITEDGKQAMIYFHLPDEVDRTKTFAVYNYTGIEGSIYLDDDGKWHARCLAELSRAPIAQFKAPMFAKVETNSTQTPIISFKHFGAYELLHVKNISDKKVNFAHHGFDLSKPWYQAATYVEPDDGNAHIMPSGEWDGEDFSMSQTINAGGEGVFVSWYIPSGFPIADAHLIAAVDGKQTSSSNTFSSNVEIQRGCAYHMYATWDGKSLSFDKKSDTSCPDDHHPHIIDLGLSSGVKWACCNVDADKPEVFGGYYAWGETSTKDNYCWGTYKWCEGSNGTINKYCCQSTYGKIDNKTILDPEDDVAYMVWGSKWRMPTKEEQDELRNCCDWEWTSLNGVTGMLVKSKNNDNSIFLPAAGYISGTSPSLITEYGYYQSASLDLSYSDDSYYFYFNSSGHYWQDFSSTVGRDVGFSVRPIYK